MKIARALQTALYELGKQPWSNQLVWDDHLNRTVNYQAIEVAIYPPTEPYVRAIHILLNTGLAQLGPEFRKLSVIVKENNLITLLWKQEPALAKDFFKKWELAVENIIQEIATNWFLAERNDHHRVTYKQSSSIRYDELESLLRCIHDRTIAEEKYLVITKVDSGDCDQVAITGKEEHILAFIASIITKMSHKSLSANIKSNPSLPELPFQRVGRQNALNRFFSKVTPKAAPRQSNEIKWHKIDMGMMDSFVGKIVLFKSKDTRFSPANGYLLYESLPSVKIGLINAPDMLIGAKLYELTVVLAEKTFNPGLPRFLSYFGTVDVDFQIRLPTLEELRYILKEAKSGTMFFDQINPFSHFESVIMMITSQLKQIEADQTNKKPPWSNPGYPSCLKQHLKIEEITELSVIYALEQIAEVEGKKSAIETGTEFIAWIKFYKQDFDIKRVEEIIGSYTTELTCMSP